MVEELRKELTPIPERMRDLPVHRGYPVPFFVETVNGVPDFRITSPQALLLCVKDKLCWVCGKALGAYLVFTLGPMCCVTRTSSEPPSHRECALWSVQNCPFLTRPDMERRDLGELEAKVEVAGEMLEHNPGVMALWTTRSYERFGDGAGGLLFRVGEPTQPLEWFTRGRAATPTETAFGVQRGVAALKERNPSERKAIDKAVQAFLERHDLR